MSPVARHILDDLSTVDRLRAERVADPGLGARVKALKSYQARRFELTYRDFIDDKRYSRAARFFLEELYGPEEFIERDAQFARIVPSVVRMFPRDVGGTVAALARLHALSETLDSRMAMALSSVAISAAVYADTWRKCGRFDDRLKQIDLTLAIGRELDKYTRRAWLVRALKAMRRPAQRAGLGSLQRFLENGFEAFAEIDDVEQFLDVVARREKALATALSDAQSAPSAEHAERVESVLDKLPLF